MFDHTHSSQDYIHRVGRTARAGRSGLAINFVTQYDVEVFQRIEKLINVKMELQAHEEAEVNTLTSFHSSYYACLNRRLCFWSA